MRVRKTAADVIRGNLRLASKFCDGVAENLHILEGLIRDIHSNRREIWDHRHEIVSRISYAISQEIRSSVTLSIKNRMRMIEFRAKCMLPNFVYDEGKDFDRRKSRFMAEEEAANDAWFDENERY
jgi:hypothetical protein